MTRFLARRRQRIAISIVIWEVLLIGTYGILYQEMQDLQSNPLGLDRFHVEEKVHIELLNILKELRTPLRAFSLILNWTAKAYERGHIFKMNCQPSREKVVQKLYC
jgi:hypothetical protein